MALRSGLAKPEELLIFITKNAVSGMKKRCMKSCRHIPVAENLVGRTFNRSGYLVKRHCSDEELYRGSKGRVDDAKACLQEIFDQLLTTDPDFQRKAANFIAFFKRPEHDEFRFENCDKNPGNLGYGNTPFIASGKLAAVSSDLSFGREIGF